QRGLDRRPPAAVGQDAAGGARALGGAAGRGGAAFRTRAAGGWHRLHRGAGAGGRVELHERQRRRGRKPGRDRPAGLCRRGGPRCAGAGLAGHALSAALLAAAVLLSGDGPQVAGIAFAAVLGLVNGWNFMDGIDGLAASQAAIAGLGYAFVAGAGAPAWLALAL